MTIKGWKGFDKDFKCRGFQYEVGKEYTTDEAKACESGFHFCENPLDVFRYYAPSTSRFASVEGSGKTDKHEQDSKVACTRILIDAEIGLKGLIEVGMKFVFEKIQWGNSDIPQTRGHSSAAQTRGDSSAAQTHGNYSAAQTHGNSSAAQTHGDYSTAQTHGHSSAAQTHGNYSAAQTHGNYSAAQTHGNSSAAQTHGNYSAAQTHGNSSAAQTHGDYSAAQTHGHSSAAQTHGHSSAAQTHGDYSAAQTHGNSSAAQTHGDYSAAQTHGNYSAATVLGEQSIAVSTGITGKAKGKKTCWLVLVEWTQDKKGNQIIKGVKSARVDGKKIREDVFYTLKNGKFVEAK